MKISISGDDRVVLDGETKRLEEASDALGKKRRHEDDGDAMGSRRATNESALKRMHISVNDEKERGSKTSNRSGESLEKARKRGRDASGESDDEMTFSPVISSDIQFGALRRPVASFY